MTPSKLSASRQSNLLRQREISAQALLESHIENIDEREPRINALITVDLDGARQRAIELDGMAARGQFAGPLHGLPVGIKDSHAVAGLRCTFGSLAFENHVSETDMAHVANLRDAGAILLAKTNLPELGHGRYGGQTDNRVAGLTRNPWNPRKTVSSSSGGSAAALAAHFVALADGSDIAGSIRGPAGWCGLYGLRPTSGVVPVWPKTDPFDGTDVIGPMARSIDDLALMFDAMRSRRAAPLHDLPDPVAPAFSQIRDLRIAWCMRPQGTDTCDEVVEALSGLRDLLQQAGARVTEAEPKLPGLHAAQAVLRSFGVRLKHGERMESNPELYSPELSRSLQRAKSLTTEDLVDAMRTRDRAVHEVQDFFAEYDLMIWPSTSGLAFSADAKNEDIVEDWTPIELTPSLQLPGLSVPVGMTPDGMPCGVQFIGPKRSDLNLIALARALEPRIGFIDTTL